MKRKWSTDHRDTPLMDFPIKRKPDIVLIDVDNSVMTWRTVCAIAEITSQGSEVGKLVRTVVFLSVWGKHNFQLTVTDREGQLRSVVYELSGIRPVSFSLDFLCVIVRLFFTDK